MDAIVQDLSTTAVVPALRANMVAFWMGYGRAPGAELYEGDDLVRVVTGVSEPLFNGVFCARLIPNAVDSAIATTLAHVAPRQVPMFWWVGPWSRPANLGTHLERHGFIHAGDSPAMAVDLRTLPEEPPKIAGLLVAPVEDLQTLRTWVRVAAIGTEFPERFHEDLVALEAGVGLRPREDFYTRYIAYQDGVAVATSALLLHAGVAGIFAVATIPQVRRRGLGTAVTQRRSSKRGGGDTESALFNHPRWVSRFTDDSGSERSAIRSGCTSGVHSRVERTSSATYSPAPLQRRSDCPRAARGWPRNP